LAKQIETNFGPVSDYVFATFFLGNDFMPHFPALNLRKNGLDILETVYKKTVKKGFFLFDGETVQWDTVRRFVKALAVREQSDVVREFTQRGQVQVDVDDPENAPLVHREVECYIAPGVPGWEHRYCAALLKTERHNNALVCRDFYKVLEWNAFYYTKGCLDWGLSYPHTYPPLLTDLARFNFEGTMEFPATEPTEVSAFLKFVLPARSARHCGVVIPEKKVEEQWSFCTFQWESHLFFFR